VMQPYPWWPTTGSGLHPLPPTAADMYVLRGPSVYPGPLLQGSPWMLAQSTVPPHYVLPLPAPPAPRGVVLEPYPKPPLPTRGQKHAKTGAWCVLPMPHAPLNTNSGFLVICVDPKQDDAGCDEISSALVAFYGVKYLPQDPLRPGNAVPIPEHKRYTSRGKPSLSACTAIFARNFTTAVWRAKQGTAK